MANKHTDINLVLRRALDSQRLGRFKQAEELYGAVLQLDPANFDALQLLGLCHYQNNQLDKALDRLNAALARRRDVASVFNHRGIVLKALQRNHEALADFDAALALKEDFADACFNKANTLVAVGEPERAMVLFERAARLQPNDVRYLNNIASCLSSLGKHIEAYACYLRVVEIDPGSSVGFLNIGITLQRLGRVEDALSAFSSAIDRDPCSAEAYSGRGECLMALNRLAEALHCCEMAIKLNESAAENHYGHANVLNELKRYDDALAAYDRAIALKPSYADAHVNRAATLMEFNRNLEALEDVRASLHIAAGGNRQAERLAEHCTMLLSVDMIPAIYPDEAELAATRQRIEDVLDQLMEVLEAPANLGAQEAQVSRQALYSLTAFYLAYHQRNDRETMRKLSLVATRLLPASRHEVGERPRRGARIRVGIASQFLRDHNGANWAYNWFAQLPRDDYEITTYHFEPQKDQLARRFAELGRHRRHAWTVGSQDEVIRQMREDELDILMLPDVGMTSLSRYLSLHRIAPCQFTAWGHPVTTGSPEMDFYLSSDLMEPENAQDHYTERLVRLPNLALFLDDVPEMQSPGTATSFGLPEGRVLYGCLQSLFKYLPRYDHVFPRIAMEVPEAVFVFLEGKPSYVTSVMKARLEQAFAKHGLDAGRHVMFLRRLAPDDFDRLISAMDVCVDSIGWSGGNTSLKSIGLGVPLATVAGDFMRGRHTAGAFRLIGADEMISPSVEDYILKLVRLGKEQAYRGFCRELFLSSRHRLYKDSAFIRALDAFLKDEAGCRSRID